MKKEFLTALFALLCIIAKSQVGIGTDNPKATLDIMADASGETLSGVLIPRMTGDQIESMVVKEDHNSMLVYATEVSTDTYPIINSKGFWYYDAENSTWKNINTNITNVARPFYMPSFNLPVDKMERKTFNLYDEYKAQFDKSELPTYSPEDISFDLIYYDENVIDLINFNHSTGVMTYDVLDTDPPAGSFVNIVIIPKV